MKERCLILLLASGLNLSMNAIAASNNTCMAVVQDAVGAMDNLNAQIAGVNSRITYVTNSTVPDTLIRVDRGLDIFDRITNMGLIVGGGVAFTTGVLLTLGVSLGSWRLLQWRFPNLRHTEGIPELNDEHIDAIALNFDKFVAHPKIIGLVAKFMMVVQTANTQSSGL